MPRIVVRGRVIVSGRFTFSMVVAVLNSIKLVAFLFQLNINGELDRES